MVGSFFLRSLCTSVHNHFPTIPLYGGGAKKTFWMQIFDGEHQGSFSYYTKEVFIKNQIEWGRDF